MDREVKRQMTQRAVDATKQAAADNNLTGGAVSDPEALQAVIDDHATVINAIGAYLDAMDAGVLTRQAIINGNFAVNQRGVSGTVTLAAGAYGHDRWKAGSSGCTYTFATSNNVTTITITAGSLLQVIEGNNLFSGTYILSWTGSAQGRIGAGSYGASGITATVTGGINLNIEFNAGTLSKVQFNAGATALPFQPRSFAEELALCQRYYEKSYDYAVAPGTASAFGQTNIYLANVQNGFAIGYVQFKAIKRIPGATAAVYSPIDGTSGKYAIGGANKSASISAGQSSLSVTQNEVSTNSGNAQFQWTVDAEL